MARGMQIMKRN